MTRALCLIMFSGCASVPYKSMVRSQEAHVLEACIRWPTAVHECLTESRERCRAQGLEANCAVDGMWK